MSRPVAIVAATWLSSPPPVSRPPSGPVSAPALPGLGRAGSARRPRSCRWPAPGAAGGWRRSRPLRTCCAAVPWTRWRASQVRILPGRLPERTPSSGTGVATLSMVNTDVSPSPAPCCAPRLLLLDETTSQPTWALYGRTRSRPVPAHGTRRCSRGAAALSWGRLATVGVIAPSSPAVLAHEALGGASVLGGAESSDG